CRALHLLEEKLSCSSNRVPGFSGCCAVGKVELPLFPNPPELIWDLFTGDSRESTHFRQRIRSYNNVLSLTSLGTTETPYRQNDGGVYSFRIKGALYHNHGPLLPIDGERPKFAQIYVHDSRDLDAQVSHRMNVFQDNSLDQTILSTLTQLLQQCNWLVQTYETAGETLRSNPQLPVTLQLKVLNPRDKDPRTYNVPTADEIGILIVGSGDEEFDKRDIIIRARSGENEYQGLTRISEINHYYLALQYVLLLPQGALGWRIDIPLRGNVEAGLTDRRELLAQQRQDNPTTARGGSKHVSLAMWHSFHLFER
ncbi:hypothetical protein L873DRAFT_1882191, partial [Choiromyces venosus 120613-1]